MEFAYPYLLLVMIYGSLAVYAHFNSESQMKTMCYLSTTGTQTGSL